MRREDRRVHPRPEEDVMEPVPLLDCAGRRRSPATLSSFHQGRAPRNKGRRYPPDPPSVEEIIAVMRACGSRPEGVRLRAVIVVLWRAGLRISEALALSETRSGPPSRRCAGPAREGRQASRGRDGPLGLGAARPMARAPCRAASRRLFCVVRGPTRGRPCGPAGIRAELHRAATAAGSGDGSRRTSSDTRTRSRCPAKESRCWSSSASRTRRLAVTSTYLRGIDNTEIIHAVYERSVPMIPASPRPTPNT